MLQRRTFDALGAARPAVAMVLLSGPDDLGGAATKLGDALRVLAQPEPDESGDLDAERFRAMVGTLDDALTKFIGVARKYLA